MEGKLSCITLMDRIALRVDHCIFVIGGQVCDCVDDIRHHRHMYSVWLYNIFLEQWKKYHILKKKQVPENLIGACGVVIGEDIYTFGGGHRYPWNNELWKLTRNANGSFKWSRFLVKANKKIPSPRKGHSGWEYDEKLWTFGGHGPSINDYLNKHGDFRDHHNNQLFYFSPKSNKWTNLKYFGTEPSAQLGHATTVLDNKVWLYGGTNAKLGIDFDDLYELDMCSLTWKLIQTTTLKPEGRYACSLNVTRENHLVLHCGESAERNVALEDTWILDLSSYSWKKCTDVYSWRFYHTAQGPLVLVTISLSLVVFVLRRVIT